MSVANIVMCEFKDEGVLKSLQIGTKLTVLSKITRYHFGSRQVKRVQSLSTSIQLKMHDRMQTKYVTKAYRQANSGSLFAKKFRLAEKL